MQTACLVRVSHLHDGQQMMQVQILPRPTRITGARALSDWRFQYKNWRAQLSLKCRPRYRPLSEPELKTLRECLLMGKDLLARWRYHLPKCREVLIQWFVWFICYIQYSNYSNTIAILAQGTNWTVASSQAYCLQGGTRFDAIICASRYPCAPVCDGMVLKLFA